MSKIKQLINKLEADLNFKKSASSLIFSDILELPSEAMDKLLINTHGFIDMLEKANNLPVGNLQIALNEISEDIEVQIFKLEARAGYGVVFTRSINKLKGE